MSGIFQAQPQPQCKCLTIECVSSASSGRDVMDGRCNKTPEMQDLVYARRMDVMGYNRVDLLCVWRFGKYGARRCAIQVCWKDSLACTHIVALAPGVCSVLY